MYKLYGGGRQRRRQLRRVKWGKAINATGGVAAAANGCASACARRGMVVPTAVDWRSRAARLGRWDS